MKSATNDQQSTLFRSFEDSGGLLANINSSIDRMSNVDKLVEFCFERLALLMPMIA